MPDTPDRRALAILALTIWGEAKPHDEGKPSDAQKIAATVFNRVKRPGWWGDDVGNVCLAEKQFSTWNWAIRDKPDKNDDDHRAKHAPYLHGGLPANPNVEAVESAGGWLGECLRIARETWAMADAPGWDEADPSRGATSYYATYVPQPEWAAEKWYLPGLDTHFVAYGKPHRHRFLAIPINGRTESPAPKWAPEPIRKAGRALKDAAVGGAGAGGAGGVADIITTGGANVGRVWGALRGVFVLPDGGSNLASLAVIFITCAAWAAWYFWSLWRLKRRYSSYAPWMEPGAAPPEPATVAAPTVPGGDLAAAMAQQAETLAKLAEAVASLKADPPDPPKPAPRRASRPRKTS